MRLLELAQKQKPHSFRVSSATEWDKSYITNNQIKTLGITAGASSPQILVDEILGKLKEFFPNVKIENYPNSREDDMYFRLPKELLKI
jgi:4-hydroxy-3-methylbut-2-enyl diphosphate reductase